MKNSTLLGLGRHITPLPHLIWSRLIAKTAQKEAVRVASIRSEAHRLVHHFVVREIPRQGEPLSPEFIGQQLNMPVDQVTTILAELEQKRTFLFRNEQGAVVWAYPATADKTPHPLTFSTGEQGYAA